MKPEKVFELYEKLYFHEVDVREKIAAKYQIPLAILISLTSVFAAFLKNMDFTNHSVWNVAFSCTVAISFGLHITSIIYFAKSFYGSSYDFIPSAIDSERYRQDLFKYHSKQSDCNELVEKSFRDYLFKYYSECASANSVTNDKRSENLHKCTTYFAINLLPMVIAFAIFTVADISKVNDNKPVTVEIKNPVELHIPKSAIKVEKKVTQMTKENNPPPQPPPKRVIKEDIKLPGTFKPKNSEEK